MEKQQHNRNVWYGQEEDYPACREEQVNEKNWSNMFFDSSA